MSERGFAKRPPSVKDAEENDQVQRQQMVERQLAVRGITDPKVLSAFLKVPRQRFVPDSFKDQTYEDHPIGIGYDQTISQPYIVAFMLESLDLQKGDRVLEIGTGTGYQTAILAELVSQVYSIEIVPELYRTASERLTTLGYSNIHLKCGNGRSGWPEQSPFDKIILSAATEEIPEALIRQVRENGLLTAPLGRLEQSLVLGKKVNGILTLKHLVPVRFVPLANH